MIPTEKLGELVLLSNKYGVDPRYVLVGGGNSSYKTERELYIKASGVGLGTVGADGFVGMDRARLDEIMTRAYDREDDAKREAAVLADMLDARLPDSVAKRPSVETLLHNLFERAFVLHLHPALVNGMTCGARGAEAAREIFGDAFVWIPEYRPGYELAKLCEREIAAFRSRRGTPPDIIFLQNHGVFVAGDTTEQVDAIYADIMGKLGAYAAVKPGSASGGGARTGSADADGAEAALIERVFADMPGASRPSVILYANNPDIAGLIKDRASFAPLAGAFTPDHIVYCRADFLYIDGDGAESCARLLPEAFARYSATYGYAPRVVCARGVGAFFTADTRVETENARTLFLDAADVAVYSRNFGGHRHLSRELTDFIINWEIESYRRKVAKADI